MEFLIVVPDRLTRDQIKVGLLQFPEFRVTCGEGYAAINQAREKQYDCVVLGIDSAGRDGLRLLQHLRSFDRRTDVVLVTSERHARDLAGEKSRLNIVAFLHPPLDVTEFFRLIGRLRDRKKGAGATA